MHINSDLDNEMKQIDAFAQKIRSKTILKVFVSNIFDGLKEFYDS